MIYFIEAVGLDRVKIGYSKTPIKRMAELQTGCPVELKMIRFCQGEMCEEKQLHKQLSHFREIGEWFRLTDGTKNTIERYKNKNFTDVFSDFQTGIEGGSAFEGIESDSLECFGCGETTHARFASQQETEEFEKTYNICCNYGLYITVITCETGCGINSYMAIGDHKGYAYFMTARMSGFTVCCGKKTNSTQADDSPMRCIEDCGDSRESIMNWGQDSKDQTLDNSPQTSSDESSSQDAS
tara:strand:+ start:3837 stop:4556 length:720 start_codon:yes stop_codon:yes gene_type:complete